MKKEPRWVVPFLRALERTGEARAAADDAGIDHTTAYARRKAHADFADRWAAALAAHEARVKAEEEAEIEAIRNAPPSGLRAATSPANAGEDLVASGGKMRRVGHDRWSKGKERLFLDELLATANIKRSATAAGVSVNTVLKRRLTDRVFAAKWEAIERTAKTSINMYLVEETRKTFDPDELEIGEVQPKVTIDQAIRISQLGASKSRREEEELPDPYAEEAAAATPNDVAELRAKIVRKLRRMRDRDMPDMIAKGWSFDEEFDHMVPPGWVRVAKQ